MYPGNQRLFTGENKLQNFFMPRNHLNQTISNNHIDHIKTTNLHPQEAAMHNPSEYRLLASV